jgi:uncharacterized repeat protein (TIGR03803 family)
MKRTALVAVTLFLLALPRTGNANTKTVTILYSFGGSPTDGNDPVAGLVQGSDGNFYGTTRNGGANGVGSVFRISPSGTYTSLYSFGSYPGDGEFPYAGLVQGSDSNFYGTTDEGGDYNWGTVFRISPSGTYTSLYFFGSYPADGYYPEAGLVQGNDGNFYGTTSEGGADNAGTVFRISPSGAYTTLYSFIYADGASPLAGLVQGSDSNFYGTTEFGGKACMIAGSCGTVFRISPSGIYTNLHSFVGHPSDGASPEAGLVQGSDGNLYGTTVIGGKYGPGTIFKLAVGCAYTLSATNFTLPAKGGMKSVRVKVAGTACSWMAVSNDPFITITSGSNYTGNGKVYYTVPGNTNTTALSGTMTIAGQTFTVNQAAGGCKFSLSPRTGKIKAAGGSAAVKVKPNFSDCAWSAVSNDSFITITNGASGIGRGTVGYTVSANTSTTALTGSVTIAGETFAVIQAGVK